jgi:hypothetical protein
MLIPTGTMGGGLIGASIDTKLSKETFCPPMGMVNPELPNGRVPAGPVTSTLILTI